eukprot:CAMPEP_0181316648 /NCGR_PEP_ID=MMETSP1101-20121128/16010_1 /TAXON_ID=46948 /ORGANISM="Rhodomonas abbreviata, Strain Caron Lab Isolate" /LENGTH=169 /DNA_ID=CAMNT_0023423915 /DNA_START=42 /DNA_END=548 /DNA_ORIENTATION=+
MSSRVSRSAAERAALHHAQNLAAAQAQAAREGRGDDSDDDDSWRAEPTVDHAGYSWTRHRWVVVGVDGWRYNVTAQTVEFHVIWASGRPSWEPIAGCGDYARSASEFLLTVTGPPPRFRDRALERSIAQRRQAMQVEEASGAAEQREVAERELVDEQQDEQEQALEEEE